MLQALTSAFRVATDRRFRDFRDQRRILGHEARGRAAGGRPAKDGPLLRDGIEFLPNLVSDQQIRDIHGYFADKLAHDPYRKGATFTAGAIPAATHVAHYCDCDIIEAPHLLGIANDRRVLQRVEGFLGAKPVLSAMRVWWSSPTPGGEAEHAERFHRDFDDLRFLKLFVYLTDVDEGAGPHLFIRGSHRVDKLSHIARYSDEEVAVAFAPSDFLTITGKAGTAFLENTYGIHRGVPPKARRRLIFQPLYTLAPTIYGPKKPLRPYRAQDGDVDLMVSRVFVSHPSSARR